MQHPTIQKTRCSAFTLVELLTVIIIIAILATISLGVMNSAMRAANEAKTRATILRIDTAILQIFESYEERYKQIEGQTTGVTFDTAVQAAFGTTEIPTVNDVTEGHRVAVRLHMIRDLMRMEMPSSWAEVAVDPLPFKGNTNLTLPIPAVVDYYKRALSNAGDATQADLFYMIVANLNPEALEFFGATEVADTNDNGLLEFVDAWGRPIRFLRWAPALAGSALQADVVSKWHVPVTGEDPETIWNNGGPAKISEDDWKAAANPNATPSFAKACHDAVTQNPDPFDRFRVQPAWFMYPLIYSAGADGKADYYFGEQSDGTVVSPAVSSSTGMVAGMLDPYEHPFGYPVDTDNDGELHHYDNITNHQK